MSIFFWPLSVFVVVQYDRQALQRGEPTRQDNFTETGYSLDMLLPPDSPISAASVSKTDRPRQILKRNVMYDRSPGNKT